MQLAFLIAICGLVSVTVAAPLALDGFEQGQKGRANRVCSTVQYHEELRGALKTVDMCKPRME